jgi:hypothetical protein
MIRILAALLFVALIICASEPTNAAWPGSGRYLASTTGGSCTAGATDFSLTTGCNISLYHGGFF